MKNQKIAKIVTCLLVVAMLSTILAIAPRVKADSEGVYVWIDPNQGGGSAIQNLQNRYNTFNLTVDVSNATNQNDDCQIRLSTNSSENIALYWQTDTNNTHPEFYEQSLSICNTTDTTELDSNTTTFSPNLVWDGNTIYWYGNASNVLLGSLDTTPYFFNVSLTYVDATMAFDSGNITINIQALSTSTPTPTLSPTPLPTSAPTDSPTPTPLPASTPSPSSTITPTPASTLITQTDQVPEFPVQMLMVILVVSMIMVLAAVIFAKNKLPKS